MKKSNRGPLPPPGRGGAKYMVPIMISAAICAGLICWWIETRDYTDDDIIWKAKPIPARQIAPEIDEADTSATR